MNNIESKTNTTYKSKSIVSILHYFCSSDRTDKSPWPPQRSTPNDATWYNCHTESASYSSRLWKCTSWASPRTRTPTWTGTVSWTAGRRSRRLGSAVRSWTPVRGLRRCQSLLSGAELKRWGRIEIGICLFGSFLLIYILILSYLNLIWYDI